MGAWGPGIYDNDDAADWSAEVGRAGLQAVELALDAVLEAGDIDAPEGACALAAADVVARLVSGRGERSAYCEDVVAWIDSTEVVPTAALIIKARTAVERVRGADSELSQLWSEDTKSLKAWSASLADIEHRLAGESPIRGGRRRWTDRFRRAG